MPIGSTPRAGARSLCFAAVVGHERREHGCSLIRRVRGLPVRQGGNVPAIALTAYARSEDRVRVMRAGYHTHVVKPVEPAELILVIANLTGRSGNG